MKLSLCITTYNRHEMTIQSFEKVLNDDRIDDIVILDDCSTDDSYEKLKQLCSRRIKVYQQVKNVGMSLNKLAAIEKANNEWCIIFDSDNIIDTDYLDAFYKYITNIHGAICRPESNYIFCPDFAKPDFDYTKYSNSRFPYFGQYNAKDAAERIQDDSFNCLMNTCNYIVNRDFYLKTYQYNKEHVASDTVWHNYNHLKAGGEFAIVPGMQYFHRVHKESGFMNNIDYNMKKANEVRKLISQL